MKRSIPRHFGALYIDKPAGPSSHELVQWVRWALRETSVGHCGTLDPGATGLMILLVGRATRLASRITAADKSYEAVFALGAETDTDDSDGELLRTEPVAAEQFIAARNVIHGGWLGEHWLEPPRYSAVRVDGQRAHEAARAGQPLHLKARPMAVLESREISMRDWSSIASVGGKLDLPELPRIGARLRVSKGTYIRSLARELGRRVGAPVHLAALRRSGAGRLTVADESVVSGLDATLHGHDRRGAPQWRIRWGEGERESQAEKLIAALRSPWPLLDQPVIDLEELREEPIYSAFRRFQQGQRVAFADACIDALQGVEAATLVDESARCAVLVRRDRTLNEEGRYSPDLVLDYQLPSPRNGEPTLDRSPGDADAPQR